MATTVRTLTFVFGFLASGCTYDSPGAYEGSDSPEIPPVGTPTAQPCRAGEQGVVLCVDFEDAPIVERVLDQSPYRHQVTATAVTSVERFAGEQAVQLSNASSLRVPESAMLDLSEYTVEMWIHPGPGPQPPRAGLFDQYAHYTMELDKDLKVACGTYLGAKPARSDGRLLRERWSHVVCRYVGGEMRVYLNGRLSGCKALPAPSIALAQPGSAIGARFDTLAVALRDRFVGGVDNVRIYDRGLTPAQICTAAGGTTPCDDVCPADDGPDLDD